MSSDGYDQIKDKMAAGENVKNLNPSVLLIRNWNQNYCVLL